MNNTVTVVLEWNRVVGNDVDYYRISISPPPLSHPESNLVQSSPWSVTLDPAVQYRTSIVTGNCVGESTEATINIGILIDNLYSVVPEGLVITNAGKLEQK